MTIEPANQRAAERHRRVIAKLATATIAVLAAIALGSCADELVVEPVPGPAPEIVGLATRSQGAPRLRVVSPTTGAAVTSPVRIEIAVDNYNLAPKGLSRDSEGHMHVIEGHCVQSGEVIDDNHVHVGDGSAVAEIELPPGEHRLCVQLGDGFHTAVAIHAELDVTVTG